MSRSWWRIDSHLPDQWEWAGFAQPRHRFDPASGRFRVRYAGSGPQVAARERFTSRRIDVADGDLWLIELQGDVLTLPLTRQTNLDLLDLDDRISTGRVAGGPADPLLAVGHELADAVFDWWQPTPPALTYRSRRSPAGRNVAFASHHELVPVRVGRLADATALLAELVVRHGFVVPSRWLF